MNRYFTSRLQVYSASDIDSGVRVRLANLEMGVAARRPYLLPGVPGVVVATSRMP